jgi:thiamine-phosphate pyrophosphorylase
VAHHAIFIMNDDAIIAKAIDADGVHLGLQDMTVKEARQILGEHKIIGGTANSLGDVLQRVGEGCDYVGLGPLRFTPTKEKLSPVLGLEGYKNIITALQQNNTNIPVFAIGGVVPEDVEGLMETGVYGVAVSGIVTVHPDRKLLIEQFNSLLYGTVEHSR